MCYYNLKVPMWFSGELFTFLMFQGSPGERGAQGNQGSPGIMVS